jgi:hypothetical protein
MELRQNQLARAKETLFQTLTMRGDDGKHFTMLGTIGQLIPMNYTYIVEHTTE